MAYPGAGNSYYTLSICTMTLTQVLNVKEGFSSEKDVTRILGKVLKDHNWEFAKNICKVSVIQLDDSADDVLLSVVS